MEIRELVPGYAVSPQIEPTDIPALAEAGFTTIINNRPDQENPPERASQVMRQAVEAAGMTYVENPIYPGQITMDNVDAQRAAIDAGTGPVFAYCASGNRSSIVWAHAMAGRQPTDELIATAAKWGYRLDPYRGSIDQLAMG